MKTRFIGLVAGGFCSAALATEGIAQAVKSPDPVTAVVRTDLGQLKWVKTEPADYTPLEKAGHHVFVREGCWFCHSVNVSPLAEDKHPLEPPLEKGETAFDGPPTPSQGQIGPNLSREGLKYSNEWHYAHFWNPRSLNPDSYMKSFAHLFDRPASPIKIMSDSSGNKTLEKTADTEKLFDFSSKEQFKLTPNINGLLFVPKLAQGKYPIIWTPNDEYTGDSVKIAAETSDLEALIAYLQKLGTNRGKWRDLDQPQVLETVERGFAPSYQVTALPSLPRLPEWIAYGKAVYEKRCIGCHGIKGDGNGVAATFLYKQRPRNFTQGEFKFRLTKEPLPSDQDLLRTLTRGVRGTAMPTWAELPLTDRLAVIQYVKYELAVDRSDPTAAHAWFVEEPPGPAMVIPPAPAPTQALVTHGKEIWENAKCWECHGHAGQGNGEKAAGLKDDFGFPIRPANLAAGQFKSGARVEDIYRTISTGLAGTPMPTFRDAFPDQDRWAIAYYVLSLSAYKDPLSGQPLPLSETDRLLLDDPHFETESPEKAYMPLAKATSRPPVDSNDKLASDFAKRKPGMPYDIGSESTVR